MITVEYKKKPENTSTETQKRSRKNVLNLEVHEME